MINPSASKAYQMKKLERDARNRRKKGEKTSKKQRYNIKEGVNESNKESRDKRKKASIAQINARLDKLWEK